MIALRPNALRDPKFTTAGKCRALYGRFRLPSPVERHSYQHAECPFLL